MILMPPSLEPMLETTCMKYRVRVGRAHDTPGLCTDYMVPQMLAAHVNNAFKYISLQVGSNDLCSACYAAETGNRQHIP